MSSPSNPSDLFDAYGAIARVYDRLNAEINYAAWADFVEACFLRYLPKKPALVLDLACGTGSMTLELRARGYDMIGIDRSPDMLCVAYERADAQNLGGLLFLCQDMRDFELYGTVGAISCCLDSINYLLDPRDVKKCFAAAHNYLDPDGLFLFDVNSPYKFENIYGDNAYVLEDEMTDEDGNTLAVYCGWQNHYDHDSHICTFDLSLFEEQPDSSYVRADEQQKERCYTKEELCALLSQTGFEVLGVFGDWNFSEPQAACERYYFVARAKK